MVMIVVMIVRMHRTSFSLLFLSFLIRGEIWTAAPMVAAVFFGWRFCVRCSFTPRLFRFRWHWFRRSALRPLQRRNRFLLIAQVQRRQRQCATYGNDRALMLLQITQPAAANIAPY